MTEIVTFGCRLNAYESEVIRRHVDSAGFTNAIVINTCTVTAEAERQAGQAVRRLRKENPTAKLIVTGCAAQVHAARFADMGEVDFVVGNDIKLLPETYKKLFASGSEKLVLHSIEGVKETVPHMVEGFEGMARAFVQVQNGCDHRCTFCIIPYGRGPSRSVEAKQVVDQVRLLVERGYNEVVLTGVDLTSYGQDLEGKPSLGALVQQVLREVPDLPRVRLSSIDAVEMDADLWEVVEREPRFMPHLHISLQAGDDVILKRMKRRHSRDDIRAFCAKIRQARPDMVLGADIIAGFPTETDEMFQNTYDLVQECGLTWLHVFTYSARSGTPAAKMPQVHGSLRKERAARLRALGEAASKRYYEGLIGKRHPVLVEQKGLGCTPGFAKILIPPSAVVGKIVEVEAMGWKNDKIDSRLVKE